MDLAYVEGALEPWRAACEGRLRDSISDYHLKSRQEQLKHILQQCLYADFNLAGSRCLPPGIKDLHATHLNGRFLLQVDEVVNIGTSAKQRYLPGGGHRCLKLLLTDGTQQVVGLEYEFIPALNPLIAAGTKVLVNNAMVRRGMLLLTPNNLVVLAGQVERLEQARQRAVEQWNQPAVGRRGPPAQIHEVIQQATAAAWKDTGSAPNGVDSDGQQQDDQRQTQQPPAQQQHWHSQQQQQQQPARPQPAVAVLRQPQAVAAPLPQQRQTLYLPPPPQPSGVPPPPSNQQQPRHFVSARQLLPAHQQSNSGIIGEDQSPSFGSLPLRQRLRQDAGGAGCSHDFSFVGQPSEAVKQSQSISLQGGSNDARQQQGNTCMPLQPVNREARPTSAKTSRLQLRQPAEPADLSFVRPTNSTHQPSHQQQLPAVQSPGALQLGAATGTNDDPIVIDGDDEPFSPCAMQLNEQPLQQKENDPGCSSDGWNDDLEPPDEGPKLEPYEMGFDEHDGNGDADEYAGQAEEEWQEGAVGEGWEDEQRQTSAIEEEGDGGEGLPEEEAMQPDGSVEEPAHGVVAVPDADVVPDTTRVGEAAGINWQTDAGSPTNPLSVQPPCQLPANAAPTSSAETAAGSRGDGEACSPPVAPSSSLQQAAGAGGSGSQSTEGSPPGPVLTRPSFATRRRQVVESDDESDGLVEFQKANVKRQPPQSPVVVKREHTAAGDDCSEARSMVQPDRATAELDAEMALAPLDERLLKPAPSLLDLMARASSPSPPSIPQPQLPPLPASSRPNQPSGSKSLSAAAMSSVVTVHGSVRSGGKPSGGSGSTLLRVSGGTRTLQLRPSLRTGSASMPLQPAITQQREAVGKLSDVVMLTDSDDDVPVFDGLVDEDEPAGTTCCAEEEPFTYLLLLAERAKTAGSADFPITASIFGLVKTMVGKLQYSNPDTGAWEYHVVMLIEDGSMVCQARLGHQFMQELFEIPPKQLKQQLADPATKGEAMQLVHTLQKYLGSYSGLMRVTLPVPGAVPVVQDLLGGLTPAQAAALQRRAMS